MTLNSPATMTCGFTLALTLFLTPPSLFSSVRILFFCCFSEGRQFGNRLCIYAVDEYPGGKTLLEETWVAFSLLLLLLLPLR